MIVFKLQYKWLALIGLLTILTACATQSHRETLAQAEAAYAGLIATAIELREFGILDKETAQELTPAFEQIDRMLNQAHEAIVNGNYEIAEDQIAAAEALILDLSREINDP